VQGDERVTGLAFSDDKEPLDVGMVIVSAGIRPRDEIARVSGLEVHARGGVVVDDKLKTSHDDIYAIGEVALHRYVALSLSLLLLHIHRCTLCASLWHSQCVVFLTHCT
jgi:nitrite reductase (NADH) large subunit